MRKNYIILKYALKSKIELHGKILEMYSKDAAAPPTTFII